MNLKSFLRISGLSKIYWSFRNIFSNISTILPNFIFQRIFRVNSNCPWSVHFTSRVMHPNKMHIHPSVLRYFAASGGCYIQGNNGLFIGKGSMFAWGVKIITANHNVDNFDIWDDCEPVHIGENCWLGANVVILPGVQLGNGVIVAAGSVVTKSFSGNCVIGGVPAKLIRTRAGLQIERLISKNC